MAKYYFIRHGEADFSEANTKVYQGWGFNMQPLSEKGIEQIKVASKDSRLKKAKIIVTSPYGRTMHTASILAKELGLDVVVESDLHEWVADANYKYLSDEDAMNSFREFTEFKGIKDESANYDWETAESIANRTRGVLEKYSKYDETIVVCHGTVMQYFLGIVHPDNGQIEEYVL
ncbi:histidine phosphatase family protein [Butyrivibrio sp. NC3005]|uniref:histidine phosphatase family protein n=1 Tax=Butyrivibrio sp. NC3005 TaxID=1280685 RepID=UPI00041C3199|nr:histidine phosphatase family protein [Butyrivibrio sp. NC3005]